MNTILCCCSKDGIVGDGKSIPWNKEIFPRYFDFFDEQTKEAMLVMGKNTLNHLDKRFFEDRSVIVVSTTIKSVGITLHGKEVEVYNHLHMATSKARSHGKCFFIGGPKLLSLVVKDRCVDRIIIVKTDHLFPGTVKITSDIFNPFRIFFTEEWHSNEKNPYRATLELWRPAA